MNLRQLSNQTGYAYSTLFKLKERGLIRTNLMSDDDYTSRLIKLLRLRKHFGGGTIKKVVFKDGKKSETA